MDSISLSVKLRGLVAFALCSVGFLLSILSLVATPSGITGSDAAAAGTWSIVSSPNTTATDHNYLQAVTCLSASDCWAVGHYIIASVNQTLTERWNGSSWTIVPSPNSSTTQTNYLNSVTCMSTSDCWAVGYYYNNGSITQTLIERWDGTSWAIVPSPNTSATRNNFLYGVTCASASNCWATGGYYTGSVNQTLIERWDGTSWAIVSSPNGSTTDQNVLYGVTCASASECWAVGFYLSRLNSILAGVNQTLILRWDGSSWTISPSANSLPIQDNHLFSVTCTSATECWAVGDYLNNSGTSRYAQSLIQRWDGGSWTIASSPNTSDTQTNVLFGVGCTSATECWAAGYYFNAGRSQTLIERWDGNAWVIASSPNTKGTESNVLHGATCVPSSDCWAVGDYASGTFPTVGRTLTERYTLGAPTPTSASSRKRHGTAGDFDIDLPITGDPGVECRTGGLTNDYQLIVTFPSAVVFDHAAVTSGSGSVSDASGNGTTQISVNLTGVTNAQKITLTLFGVNDGMKNGNVVVQMGVLVGDINNNRVVSNTDVASVKAQVAAPVTSSNFRNDVDANGTLSNTDVAATKAQVGTSLP
jgi:hypothetical protein